MINSLDIRSENINFATQLLFMVLNFAPITYQINIDIKYAAGSVYCDFIHIFYPGKSKMLFCHYT